MLSKVFVPKREEMKEGERKLRNKELHTLHFLPCLWRANAFWLRNLKGKTIWWSEKEKWTEVIYVRFQVLTAAGLKITAFLNVTLCNLLDSYQRFGGTFCLDLHGIRRDYLRKESSSGNGPVFLIISATYTLSEGTVELFQSSFEFYSVQVYQWEAKCGYINLLTASYTR
jgi:hypothetical protein